MPIRVMVVDDSVVVRRSVSDALASHDQIDVVATAVDGAVALRKIADLLPAVVVLDIEMPVLDGLETLVAIRARWPQIAVIMFSTLSQHGASVSLEALTLGAVDIATKPLRVANRQEAHDHVVEHLLPRVLLWGAKSPLQISGRKTASKFPTQSYRADGYGGRSAASRGGAAAAAERRSAQSVGVTPPPKPEEFNDQPIELIVLGSSTGGPDALAQLIPRLPADLPVPVVIVQHMPPVFTAMLAKRLDNASALAVSESIDGETLSAGHVYIAAGDKHLELHRNRQLFRSRHTGAAKENSCRPAVDVLFRTAAAATRGRLLAVVLTGMGQDGLLGCHAVVDAGGRVLAQDEASSVVWGMPGFVARSGLASAVLPLTDLPGSIARSRPGSILSGATP